MHCALSCICLCHVLVCAGGMLASVLQFFMVLVQQAITGITFEVRFEVRRHQHISSSTNLRMILQKHLYSWYFLIIPLFSTFSLVYVFVSLFCSHLCSCPSAIALSLLFSTSSLPSSPLLPSLLPLYHSDPDGFIYHPKEARQPQSPGHCSCRTGGPQASNPHDCKVCEHGQLCQALISMQSSSSYQQD